MERERVVTWKPLSAENPIPPSCLKLVGPDISEIPPPFAFSFFSRLSIVKNNNYNNENDNNDNENILIRNNVVASKR